MKATVAFLAQGAALLVVTALGGPVTLGNVLCFTLLATLGIVVVTL